MCLTRALYGNAYPHEVIGSVRAIAPNTLLYCLLVLQRVPLNHVLVQCSHAILETWGQAHMHLLLADIDEYFVLPTPGTTLATVLRTCTNGKTQVPLFCTGKQCHSCVSMPPTSYSVSLGLMRFLTGSLRADNGAALRCI